MSTHTLHNGSLLSHVRAHNGPKKYEPFRLNDPRKTIQLSSTKHVSGFFLLSPFESVPYSNGYRDSNVQQPTQTFIPLLTAGCSQTQLSFVAPVVEEPQKGGWYAHNPAWHHQRLAFVCLYLKRPHIPAASLTTVHTQ